MEKLARHLLPLKKYYQLYTGLAVTTFLFQVFVLIQLKMFHASWKQWIHMPFVFCFQLFWIRLHYKGARQRVPNTFHRNLCLFKFALGLIFCTPYLGTYLSMVFPVGCLIYLIVLLGKYEYSTEWFSYPVLLASYLVPAVFHLVYSARQEK